MENYKLLHEIKTRLINLASTSYRDDKQFEANDFISFIQIINSLNNKQLLECENLTVLEHLYRYTMNAEDEISDSDVEINPIDIDSKIDEPSSEELKYFKKVFDECVKESGIPFKYFDPSKVFTKEQNQFLEILKGDTNNLPNSEFKIKLKILKREPLNYDEACVIIEDVLDTLVEVGNGASDEELHNQCNNLFGFRDLYLKNQKPQ